MHTGAYFGGGGIALTDELPYMHFVGCRLSLLAYVRTYVGRQRYAEERVRFSFQGRSLCLCFSVSMRRR